LNRRTPDRYWSGVLLFPIGIPQQRKKEIEMTDNSGPTEEEAAAVMEAMRTGTPNPTDWKIALSLDGVYWIRDAK
jgi:hypothetical protein